MKQALKFLDIFILIFAFIAFFSVQVYPWGKVWISGGDITLTVDIATEGEGLGEVTNETGKLSWMSGGKANKKITVQTNLESPQFTLKVQAVNISGMGADIGRAVEEVILSAVAQDFITDIPARLIVWGNCTLKYTASATAAQGAGKETHTITYTIVDG